MILRALRKLNRDQRGFTLIELLVVITILGLLAAVVTVSLLGVTSTAKNNALAAEKQTVQSAVDAMLHDQHVDPSLLSSFCESNPNHVQPAKNDPNWQDNMEAFPGVAPFGPLNVAAAYSAPNPNTNTVGTVTVLSTHYLRERKSPSAFYICDTDGNIYQKAK